MVTWIRDAWEQILDDAQTTYFAKGMNLSYLEDTAYFSCIHMTPQYNPNPCIPRCSTSSDDRSRQNYNKSGSASMQKSVHLYFAYTHHWKVPLFALKYLCNSPPLPSIPPGLFPRTRYLANHGIAWEAGG